MIFSCGPSEAEAQLISRDYWRVDEYGIHYFKRTAPVLIRQEGRLAPITGPVVFIASADPFWGGDKAKPYRSKVVENPTYATLFGAACASVKKTRDTHHSFIEGARLVRRETLPDGREVAVLELSFGS